MNFKPRSAVQLKTNKTRVTVDLEPEQQLVKLEANQVALVITKDQFYRLGGQVDEVMAAHVLAETTPVVWCSVSQKWEDAK